MPAKTGSQRTWWKDATVYQIWPASYKDSNGDGIGDIGGIISTLDYLKYLGIDIIWVSPMYDSPQDDMGYDVSNYEDIYPPYGTIQDAENLIHECHARDMRIVFDLVINHTSYLHAWFKESRSSKSNAKRDWYIWRPAKYDSNGSRQPPNNWRAHFGGSAWEWDETSQEYYFHLFAPQQPDLNWENATTRAAIYASALTFWLDKGVDGFRIDTVNMYSKDPSFPDAPIIEPEATYQFHPPSFVNGPRMHEFLREMHSVVLSRYDCMTVGELPHTTDPDHVRRYVGAAQRQLDMVFQFDVVDLGQGSAQRLLETSFSTADLRAVVARTQALTPGSDAWSTAFLENHDQPRSISRFGDPSPAWHARSGRLLAIWLATLTGTLFLYQGQELGTPNLPSTFRLADFRDVEACSHLAAVRAAHPSDPARLHAAEAAIRRLGRDNARAPLAWDTALPHAGFTSAPTPWMRMHDHLDPINVASQRRDPHSVLRFWRRLLRLRRAHLDLFAHGTFALLDDAVAGEHGMAYTKTFGRTRLLVVLNFSPETTALVLPSAWVGACLLVGNLAEKEAERRERRLLGWEARVYLKEEEAEEAVGK